MRIFVHEYIHGELSEDAKLPESLRREGQAMLSALAADFGRLPGVKVVTLCPPAEQFQQQARAADWTVVIAPEGDRILEIRCRWVEQAGGRLLGPSSAAVLLTADKLELGRHLQDQGIPTPPCYTFPLEVNTPEARGASKEQPFPCLRCGPLVTFPAVLKPRFGAGSQATFLARNRAELEYQAATARAEGFNGPLLVQPFVPGQAASVAVLVGPNQVLPLRPATQELSTDGRFRYLGGTVPLAEPLAARAVDLARRAVATVPELRGYVGVDLVLGERDVVLEINPRLTTSYVGLRVLAETNLADALLRIAGGESVIEVRWRTGTVRFWADGSTDVSAKSR